MDNFFSSKFFTVNYWADKFWYVYGTFAYRPIVGGINVFYTANEINVFYTANEINVFYTANEINVF